MHRHPEENGTYITIPRMHTPPPKRRRTPGPAPVILLVAILTAGCATNPVTGKSDYVLMSEQQEIALGQQYSREILREMPAYESEIEEAIEEGCRRLGSVMS